MSDIKADPKWFLSLDAEHTDVATFINDVPDMQLDQSANGFDISVSNMQLEVNSNVTQTWFKLLKSPSSISARFQQCKLKIQVELDTQVAGGEMAPALKVKNATVSFDPKNSFIQIQGGSFIELAEN